MCVWSGASWYCRAHSQFSPQSPQIARQYHEAPLHTHMEYSATKVRSYVTEKKYRTTHMSATVPRSWHWRQWRHLWAAWISWSTSSSTTLRVANWLLSSLRVCRPLAHGRVDDLWKDLWKVIRMCNVHFMQKMAFYFDGNRLLLAGRSCTGHSSTCIELWAKFSETSGKVTAPSTLEEWTEPDDSSIILNAR